MADLASIGLEIRSTGLDQGIKRLRGLQDQGAKTERSIGGVSTAVRALQSAVAAVGVAQLGRQMYSAIAGAQSLQASLKTVTGSVEAAGVAWDELLDFAKTTPFTLDQSVNAFIRMKSLGLDPTREALTSFGNTSAAMGKDLMQMIEAVADASTFEFERLKEFGIRASQQGDQVSFTFQGVTTTVAKNSQAITQYLENIGNTQFAGAMADQMDTLNGQASNLEDSIYQMWLAFGDAGATDLFATGMSDSATAVQAVTEAIEAGKFDWLFQMIQNITTSGNEMVTELANMGAEAQQMGNTFNAALADIQSEYYSLKAAGMEAFAGLTAGAADVINKGLIPIQKALNSLDSAFASILEKVSSVLGPAGKEFAAQAERIRAGMLSENGIDTSGLYAAADAARTAAASSKNYANELRGTNIVLGPMTEHVFEYEKATEEADKATKKSTSSTKEDTKAKKAAEKAAQDLAKAQADFAQDLQTLNDRLDPVSAAQREFTREQVLLQTALMNGSISMERYLDLYQRLQDAQRSTQSPSQAYGQGFGSEIASRGVVGRPNAAPGQGVGGQGSGNTELDRWLANAQANFSSFDNLAASTAQTFSQNFGTAFNDILTGQESIGEGFRQLGSTMVQSIISALGSMLAEWAAFKVAQMALGSTGTSAAIGQAAIAGPAIASAYAPAAALASLASFGANAAPATAGIAATTAAAQGAALTGMAHDGIDSVPSEGTWLLDKGERVVDSRTNGDLKSYLANSGRQQQSGGGAVNLVVNNIEDKSRAGTQERTQNGDTLTVQNFIADISGDGKIAKSLQGTYMLKRKGK